MNIRDDEEGTALVLTLGYALLAIALLFVCVDATSLYLAHKRADAAADAAALAGADGFTLEVVDGRPSPVLHDDAVEDQAQALVDEMPGVALVEANSPDGVSSRVTVRLLWRPPILSVVVPDGVRIESTATTRTAFG